jgi:hypothetical protein
LQVFEESGGDQHTLVIPDIKYADMLLLVRFMYGGEVTVPLKQLGDLQDLIQLLQLDPGHVNGKFVIENTHDKTITANIPATITVVSPPNESHVRIRVMSSKAKTTSSLAKRRILESSFIVEE